MFSPKSMSNLGRLTVLYILGGGTGVSDFVPSLA
jgi:hypothetical protein